MCFDGPWVADVPAQEVMDCYSDWEPDLRILLQVRI